MRPCNLCTGRGTAWSRPGFFFRKRQPARTLTPTQTCALHASSCFPFFSHSPSSPHIASHAFHSNSIQVANFKNSIVLSRYALQGHVAPQPIQKEHYWATLSHPNDSDFISKRGRGGEVAIARANKTGKVQYITTWRRGGYTFPIFQFAVLQHDAKGSDSGGLAMIALSPHYEQGRMLWIDRASGGLS